MDRRWLILGVLFVARTAMGFQYQSIGSSTAELMPALGIGFTEVGTLIGLYHIAGIFLSLPGGLIIQVLGDKRLCAIGLALMACGGLLIGAADHYAVAFAGRLISGVGGILFNLVITKMTTDWFARREIVLAMAVILSTWPLGIAMGLLVQPLIAVAFGWRFVMLLSAAVCLVSLLLVTSLYRAPGQPELAPTQAVRIRLPPRRMLPPVIVAGTIWGTFNAGLVGYFSFVPALLADRRGMTIATAGAMTSLALWVGIFSIPLGGFVAQRLRRPGITILLFSGTAGAALTAIATGAPPLAACVIFGLAIGPPPGVITALPARILAPADRAAGLGVFYTCHSVFQASGPMVIGWVRDHAGGATAVLCAAALFLVGPPLLGVFEVLVLRLHRAESSGRVFTVPR